MTVKQVSNTMTKSLQRMQRDLEQLPGKAYDYWVSITPIRSGRARRSTRLRDNTIQAQYPYATPLDAGSSRQAPQGMSKPTDQFIRRELTRIMRK